MSCLIDEGYVLGCRDSIGGVKGVYIASFDPAATYSIITDEIGNYATSTSPAPVHYKYDQFTEAASFSQTGTFSLENGSVFYDQQLTLMFHKQDTALRNKLVLLAQGRLSIIIQDQNNNFWLMGKENGVYAISADMQSGKAFGDMNGVTLTLQGKEREPAYKITAIDEADLATIGFTISQ